jgi:hypothetical protein
MMREKIFTPPVFVDIGKNLKILRKLKNMKKPLGCPRELRLNARSYHQQTTLQHPNMQHIVEYQSPHSENQLGHRSIKMRLCSNQFQEDHASRNPRAPYRPQSPCWSRALSQQRRGARKKDEQFNKARECETKILKTVTIFFYAFKIAHCL